MLTGIGLALLSTALLSAAQTVTFRNNPSQIFGPFTRPVKQSLIYYLLILATSICLTLTFLWFTEEGVSEEACLLFALAGVLLVAFTSNWLHNHRVIRSDG